MIDIKNAVCEFLRNEGFRISDYRPPANKGVFIVTLSRSIDAFIKTEDDKIEISFRVTSLDFFENDPDPINLQERQILLADPESFSKIKEILLGACFLGPDYYRPHGPPFATVIDHRG